MNRGFTLLEVMIAVAILGVCLTAIFSSQAGAFNVAQRARKTDVATLLARCKMAELEELVLNEGLPAIDKEGTDECCEGAEVEGYQCDWVIQRIVLPDLDATMDTEAEGMEETAQEEREALTLQAPSADEYLSGAAGDLTGLAMQLAYPVLKPSIEEQVRRATVRIHWQEGAREISFDVVQFMVAEQAAIEESEEQIAPEEP